MSSFPDIDTKYMKSQRLGAEKYIRESRLELIRDGKSIDYLEGYADAVRIVSDVFSMAILSRFK